MNKKCLGCGVELQDENMLLDGYTVNLENDLCQRCFRLKNYGEYQATTKTNEEYQQILEAVGKTKDLVVYVTDVLNVEQDLYDIRKFLPNKILLVLNKRDVIPKSVKDENAKVIYMSPQGQTLNQFKVEELSKQEHLIILCGHYEGIDQRVIDKIVDEEISIGDYVLTGGELPAMVLIDAVSRYNEGVLSKESIEEESFSNRIIRISAIYKT